MVRILALIAVGLYLGSFMVLMSLEARLNPREMFWRTISSHVLGEGRKRFDLYGLLMMVGVVFQAAAMRLHGGLGWGVPIWLCILAAMLGGLLLFPTDSHGVEPGHLPVRKRQREGVIHLHFAMACFGVAGLIVLLGQPKMGLLAHGALLKFLDWIAIIVAGSLLALILTGFIRPLQWLFGLAERVFFYASALWFGLTAIALAFGPPLGL